METFRRVKNDRVLAALSAVPIVAVVAAMTIALLSSNTSRAAAQRAADNASAEVQSLQQQARCRDDLAAAVDQANTEALSGLAVYIRALSTPDGGNPGAVDWDAILARMAAVQTARANTEATCTTR